MKKLNLIFLLLLISYFDCFSENSIQINWKVGETKQVTVTSKVQQFENGITLIDTSVISYLDLTVLEFKNQTYKIQVLQRNLMKDLGCKLDSNFLNKISNKEPLLLEFFVNKDSLTAELIDSVSYLKAVDDSYHEISEQLEKENSERFNNNKNELKGLHIFLRQNAKGAISILDLILETYKNQFSFNDTLKVIESIENPFNSEKLIIAKKKVIAEKISKSVQRINITKEYDFNFSESITSTLSETANEIVENLAIDEEITEPLNGIDEMMKSLMSRFEFEGNETTIINLNTKSNWPDEVFKKINLGIATSSKKTNISAMLTLKIE